MFRLFSSDNSVSCILLICMFYAFQIQFVKDPAMLNILYDSVSLYIFYLVIKLKSL